MNRHKLPVQDSLTAPKASMAFLVPNNRPVHEYQWRRDQLHALWRQVEAVLPQTLTSEKAQKRHTRTFGQVS